MTETQTQEAAEFTATVTKEDLRALDGISELIDAIDATATAFESQKASAEVCHLRLLVGLLHEKAEALNEIVDRCREAIGDQELRLEALEDTPNGRAARFILAEKGGAE